MDTARFGVCEQSVNDLCSELDMRGVAKMNVHALFPRIEDSKTSGRWLKMREKILEGPQAIEVVCI